MRRFTILTAAFALLAFLAVPLGMRGQTEVSWTASEQGYANAVEVTDITIDANITGTFAKASGTNAPKYYTSGSSVRMYNQNTLTITPGSDCEITEIVFTLSQSGGFTVSDGEYSVENLTGTWTGSSTNPVVFTNGSAQNRIQVITVTYTGGSTPAVATPTFDPAGGTFNAAQTVTISCATPDVTIYYTTDGSTPDDESTEYTGPITIEETTTLKAIAYDGEDNASSVATAYYAITLPFVDTPTFDPAGGSYNEIQTVTIACATEGATIYYTLDGTDPTTSSAVYSEALTIDETTTVKAMAAKENMNNSAIATAVYAINLPYSGDDYVRISSLDDLSDGDRVIIAARYNSMVNDYYAMTAAASGKPTGVAFTSTTSSNGEALPTAILNNESTYYWTVNITADGYTFTNASNAVLGYTTGTNFAPGGDNTLWTIERNTSGNSAMVAGYEGFYITNKNITARGIALNNQNNFGPYAISNNNSGSYNFYLDFFVQGAEAAITPSISADNVEIAYDATTGSITYTINNGVDGGTLTASTNDTWLTLGTVGETVPFTCSANEVSAARTATVTLTYTYGDSQTATKNVTVTQAGDPNATMTIAEVRAQGTGSVVTKGTITSISGNGTKTAYIQDATAAIVVYGSFTAAVGDEIRVSGTLTTYQGLMEITNPTVTVISQGNTIDPELMTIAEINASTNQGWYIRVEDATVTAISGQNTTIAQGDNTILVYGNLGVTVEVNDVVSLNGNIGNHNGVQITNPQNVEVQVAPAVPSVTVTPSEINAPYTETEGALAITYENIPELISFDYYFCDAEGNQLEDTDSIYPTWIYAEINEENETYTLSYIIEENDGEARTAYLKVYTYDEELEEVYAIVTVNQAAVEAPNVTWDLSAASYVQSEDPVAPTSELITWTSDFATMTNEKGQGSTGVNNFIPPTQTSTRFYKNNVLTITPTSGYAITSVVFTATTAGYAGALKNSTWVNATASVEDKIVTVTPTDGCSEIIATMGGTCGFTAVTVYYVPDTVPAITVSPATLNVDAQPHLVNYLSLTYKNIVADSANCFSVHYYDAEGVEYEPVPGQVWMIAGVTGSNYVYQVLCTIVANQGEARTAYFKVSCGETYSNLVTVNQEAAPKQYTLTVDPFENLELVTFVNDSMVMEAAGQIQVNEGDQIMLSVVALEGYVMETLMVNGVDHVNDIADDFTYTFEMPAENVTISATAVENVPFAPIVYTRATSITSGAHYIIVGFDGSDAYAMGTQNNNNRAAVIVSENGTEATVVNENVYDFVVETVEGTDYYSIYDARTPGYLYAASSSGNHLKTETELDNNGKWEITIAEDGQANVVAQGSNSRKYLRYNVSSTIFSCYVENSSIKDKVYFYVKSDEIPANEEITVEGTDFGTVEAPTSAGYNLIASPFNNVDPKDVAGMLSGNYDLYYFDQNGMDDGELKEWRNYKADDFVLKSGKGYLYSSENGTSLNFIGAPYAGDGEVTLDYTEGNRLAGWNLIGNPFNTTAYLENNRPFYVLDETGSELIESSGSIGVMQGLFVKATTTGETVTFTTTAPQTSTSGIHANLSSGSRLIDRATICFGEGSRLPKFQLNPDNTKLYITEDNLDYAVVNSSSKGEMPVNFKASKNGTYTLSVNAENVEMNYLHLIDNITGDDVNLLATPNYTFEASTADYASRFRLVFSATESNSTSSESFAYFNGSTWMVSNIGEATLLVVDMMGRVLRSETISGNAEINLNQVAGVYVLRLINGENVRTQKIVVK